MVLYDLLVGREFDPSINYNELGLYASIYQVVMYENYAPYFQMIDLASLLMIDTGSFERIQIHQREVLLLKNRNALERFQSWVLRYEGGYQKGSPMDSLFFVYGEAVSNIREIGRSYHQCAALIKRRFFCGENQHMLSFEDLPADRGEEETDPAVGRVYGQRFFESIQTGSRSRIARILEELREYVCGKDLEVLNVRHFLVDIFLQVKLNTINTYGKSHDIPFQNNASVIELIENKSYLYEILDYFMQQFEMIMERIGSGSSDSVFEDVLHYINMNYASQLKLEEIAALFGYNSSYFGKLFTQKNGCNFKTYLDKIRIEQSKKLLLETDWKVYEIAAGVGYSHVDVYHQKFKKLVNMSPAEFRRASGAGGEE
jgi:two-component system response regulator YesN